MLRWSFSFYALLKGATGILCDILILETVATWFGGVSGWRDVIAMPVILTISPD